MAQIFGKFFIYDEKMGHYNTNDINLNAIDVQTLDGCLVVFRCNGVDNTHKMINLLQASADSGGGIWEEIEASIVVVNNDWLAGIDVIDINEADKMMFRSLDLEIQAKIERREDRKEMRSNLDQVILDIDDEDGNGYLK